VGRVGIEPTTEGL